jgi:TRAP-type uncharacterized transport system fused permease subunit
VALSAFVASEIAGASYFKTSIESAKVTIGGFVVPYLIVFFPILLIEPQAPFMAAAGIVTSLLLIILLQAFCCGHYLMPLSASAKFIAGILAVVLFLYGSTQSYLLFFVGIAVSFAVAFAQWRKLRHMSH